VDELVAIGRAAGLAAVGVTSAAPFGSTRRDLDERKSRGLHGGMAFTYRNPARSTEPARALPGAQALVVGALSYLRPGPAGTGGEAAGGSAGRPHGPGADAAEGGALEGAVARYAWSDFYGELRAALGQVAQRLVDAGWRARVLADDNALVDRAAAQRAGLGWYGKNANLLLPGQGSWFVLGAVVTDAPLAPASRADQVPDGCGACSRCLDACPTGAIVAPGVVDARRCLAWLLQVDGPFPREYRVALGDRIYGCDDCQEVCPPNRLMTRRLRDGGASPAAVEDRVDLLELLGLSDDELLERYGRWYIPRREPRYLRRNALVVLGNVGDPGDPATVEAMRRALDDDDALVRAHAVWAVRRMGRTDLCDAVANDPDPLVQEELTAGVEVRGS
jgi:epoxyqueuosine reductase